VNGDDLGRSLRVNAAILRAHREGVLTSASLMVTEAAADEAVALARATPSLRVGLHLALADAPAAADHDPALGLTDADGRLRADPVGQALRLVRSRAARAAAAREVEAQLARFAATGLPLAHVDGHLHMHLVPPALEALCRLLPRRSEPGPVEVRVPAERLGPALRLQPRPLAYKLVHAAVFALLGRWARGRLRAAGLVVRPRVLGLLSTFDPPDARIVRGLLEEVEGPTELYLHPGAVAPAGDTELEALLDPGVRATLRARVIELEREDLEAAAA
jgi:hopanoid biosynthesis associated protein HpnK